MAEEHNHTVPEGVVRYSVCLHYTDVAEDFIELIEQEECHDAVALSAMADRLSFAEQFLRRLTSLILVHQDDIELFVYEDHLVVEGNAGMGAAAVEAFVDRERIREPFSMQTGRCRLLFEPLEIVIPARDFCEECLKKRVQTRSTEQPPN